MAGRKRHASTSSGSRHRGDRVRGKVARVVRDRGFCFIEPESLPAGYELERGKGIFMHESSNDGNLPAKGAFGEFEIEQDDRGIKVVRVVRWDTPGAVATPARRAPSAASTFVHPYNFVSVPEDGVGDAAHVHPFARASAAPHDRYNSERLSGWLECSLETKSWWFIPDARKQASEGDHKVLGYFTLDAVDDDSWDSARLDKDATRPAIPASSLRGMVRSVFEAATLSCFSVFDPTSLDFRIAFDPGSPPRGVRVPSGRRASYVPTRVVERRSDGTAVLQQLTGRLPGEETVTPVVLPVALVHAYNPKVRSGTPPRDRAGEPTPLWAGLDLADGCPVAAVLPASPSPHHSNRFQYRRATNVVPAAQATSLAVASGEWLVFGYLHRTGPNIENKHDERVFFRGDVPYNDPESRQAVAARLAAFEKDCSPALVVPADVVGSADRSLKGYAERHGCNRPNPRTIDKNAPHPSDFVGRQRLASGDLCYALVENGRCVRGLYPIALPRLTHENSRGDLLHHDFHPCNDHDSLCPACRVFGWVRPGEGRLAPQAGRVDTVASHVRFTHAVLDGTWGGDSRRARLATLAILGSPKPTTTAFYLKPRGSFDQARAERWPPTLQTAVHENIPLYRRDEASLRGRKFYRHRGHVDLNSHDPAAGGIRRPPGDDGNPIRDSQNQTVHLLPPGLRLGFRVYFDNLTSEELGALVFALTLSTPASWGQVPTLQHALGHGKPLGLGACEIRVERSQIDVFDPKDPAHRYAESPKFGDEAGQKNNSTIAPHCEAFALAVKEAEQQNAAIRKVRADLFEMLRADSPEGPVRYPPDPDGDAAKNYEWFVHNRRAKQSRHQPMGLGVRLPEPAEERDGSKRLPTDPREGRE